MAPALEAVSNEEGAVLATAVDVVAATYHTVNHTVEHLEGETYTITDAGLLQSVVACGFADMVAVETLAAVPDVTGQTQAAATTTITGAGFTVGAVTQATSATVPAGSVISQTPAGGTQAAAGSGVDFVVSTGP